MVSRIRDSGGYQRLRSFQAASVIYDGTVSFCDRYVDKRSRTHDQMVQAARSGRQNIAEGSRAAATSSQTELRLVNVARASLDELLLDFEDFLRQRGLAQWAKDEPRAQAVREVGRRRGWNAGVSNPTAKPPAARIAASQWSCAPPEGGPAPAHSFGAAQATPSAQEQCDRTDRISPASCKSS